MSLFKSYRNWADDIEDEDARIAEECGYPSKPGGRRVANIFYDPPLPPWLDKNDPDEPSYDFDQPGWRRGAGETPDEDDDSDGWIDNAW